MAAAAALRRVSVVSSAASALRGAGEEAKYQPPLPGRRARCAPRLQKVHNPTGAACAAAPRFLQTLARAGSLRAASGRSLKTLGQNSSSWRERAPVARHFLLPGKCLRLRREWRPPEGGLPAP